MSAVLLESQPLVPIENPIHQRVRTQINRVCTPIENGCSSVLDFCDSSTCKLIGFFAFCNVIQYGIGSTLILSSRNLSADSEWGCSSCSAGVQAMVGIIALSLSLGGIAFNACCLKNPEPSVDKQEKNYFCASAVASVGATILNIVGITMYAISCSKLSCN